VQEAELAPDTDAQVIDIEAPQGRDTRGENLWKVGAFEAEIQYLSRAVAGERSRTLYYRHSGHSSLTSVQKAHKKQ
jgi:hypothetical protein